MSVHLDGIFHRSYQNSSLGHGDENASRGEVDTRLFRFGFGSFLRDILGSGRRGPECAAGEKYEHHERRESKRREAKSAHVRVLVQATTVASCPGGARASALVFE